MTLSHLYTELDYLLESVKPHNSECECWRGCGSPRAMTFLPNDQGSFLSIYCTEHQHAPKVLERIAEREDK